MIQGNVLNRQFKLEEDFGVRIMKRRVRHPALLTERHTMNIHNAMAAVATETYVKREGGALESRHHLSPLSS